MKLTDSSAANVGTSAVSAIVITSTTFRQFLCYSATTISHAIGGAIGIVKNGIQTLTFAGFVNYTGQTQIEAGSLIIASGSLSGIISGAGSLTKYSAGTLSLIGGAGNQYTGGTFFNQGRLSFNSGSAFGTGLFTSQGGTDILTGSGTVIPNNFLLTYTLGLRTQGANTVVITGDISGVGGINKFGNGTYDLQGTLTYTGNTNIDRGFIRAKKTVEDSTATATFQSGGLSLGVSFNVSPPATTTTNFQFFQGSTVQTYAAVTLVGVPVGTTAIYISATSTLSVTVP